MLIDARTLPNDTSIETDICIVGAGPAGITLAREFKNSHFNVCLIESGGLETDAETQLLSKGEIISSDSYPKDELEAGRQRQLGGASNRWHIDLGYQTGVRHAPLDPIDFQSRDWLPHSGWCLSYTNLIPYYEKAQQVCQIGPFDYDSPAWLTPDRQPLPVDPNSLKTTLFQFGPQNIFAQQYGVEISQSRNISLYLYANATELITTTSDSRITGLRLACLNGNRFRLTARFYVLAMGGIENARLLLASNQTHTQGLGNEYDLVGRFYMDHPGFRIGAFIPRKRQQIAQMGLYDLHQAKGIPVAGKLSLTSALMQREQIVNTSIWFFPRPRGHQSPAVEALRSLLRSSRRGRDLADLTSQAKKILGGLDDITAVATRSLFGRQPRLIDAACGGWSYQKNCDRDYAFFEVSAQVEQAPNPDNRITLSQDRDVLGLPRTTLHWRWSDIDLYSLRKTQQILQREIEQAKLGRFVPDTEEKMLSKLYSAHHHMGTTRMHSNPSHGVVDQNCRVHSCPNLFIAGSSIFPTGGYANPTLTIVALSLRLADYIRNVSEQDHPTSLSTVIS
ncbi:MAG: GMC family oxidoreductase [Cyanobacteria bacterium J06554_6]